MNIPHSGGPGKMTESDKMRRRTRWYMFGAFAIAAVAFGVIAGSGINKNLVYYWTPADLHANGEKAYGATIRLGGMVAKGSIKKIGGSAVEFDVKDAMRVVHVKTRSEEHTSELQSRLHLVCR